MEPLSPVAHDLLVRRLAERHGLPLIKAHFAVRRVALRIPDRYAPLVHEEAQAAAREAAQRAGQAMAEFLRAMQPAMEAMAEAAKKVAATLKAAGFCDEDGRLVPRRDRPAWQSPYGPPTRRH